MFLFTGLKSIRNFSIKINKCKKLKKFNKDMLKNILSNETKEYLRLEKEIIKQKNTI